MCIIAVFEKNVELFSDDVFWQCARSNPDGFGLMYVDDYNRLRIWKTMSAKKFKRGLTVIHAMYNQTSPVVAHFRVGTCGEESTYNCHPFRIHDNLGYAHNGQVFNVDKKSRESDSHTFALFMAELPKNFHRNPAYKQLLEDYCSDPCVFLDNKRELVYLNPLRWNEQDGIKYSNYGHRTYANWGKNKEIVVVDAQKPQGSKNCEYCHVSTAVSLLVPISINGEVTKVCSPCLRLLLGEKSNWTTFRGELQDTQLSTREFYLKLREAQKEYQTSSTILWEVY